MKLIKISDSNHKLIKGEAERLTKERGYKVTMIMVLAEVIDNNLKSKSVLKTTRKSPRPKPNPTARVLDI